jgi:hypothetical protein
MTPQHLEWLLHGVRAPGRGNHGIGFRVVRELVAASDGELRVMSAPGTGTRVQIEWPMAAVASLEGGHVAGETAKAPDLRGHVQPVARKPVARKPVAWESLAREPVARDKSPLRVSRAGDVSGFAEGQGA